MPWPNVSSKVLAPSPPSLRRSRTRNGKPVSPGDGRKIGVVVHHVATMYPLEIQLSQLLAGGKPIAGVTWNDVHGMNAAHAREFDAVTKEAAIDLLRRN